MTSNFSSTFIHISTQLFPEQANIIYNDKFARIKFYLLKKNVKGQYWTLIQNGILGFFAFKIINTKACYIYSVNILKHAVSYFYSKQSQHNKVITKCHSSVENVGKVNQDYSCFQCYSDYHLKFKSFTLCYWILFHFSICC